jgi:polysaccharide export outer membrane protein
LTRSNITLHDGDTVFIPRAQLVYISGQVRSPGAYPVEAGMTLLQACRSPVASPTRALPDAAR